MGEEGEGMADQEAVNGELGQGKSQEMKPAVMIGIAPNGDVGVAFVGVGPEMGFILIEKAREHVLGGFKFGAPQNKVVAVRGNLPPPPRELVKG